MNGSYWAGVTAAIAAGITFNLGMLIQKPAVAKTTAGSSLIRQLIRSPLWLGGFALQFIIGMPLNMLAQSLIGPAIIPGLMAVGLVVLACSIGRNRHCHTVVIRVIINSVLSCISRAIATVSRNIPEVAWAMVLLFSFGQSSLTGFFALFGVIQRACLSVSFKKLISQYAGFSLYFLRD